MTVTKFERNRKMARRYQAGDRVADIARDVGLSHSQALQIIASTLRAGEHWYDDKLPTMLRNAISHVFFWEHDGKPPCKIWELPEAEAARIVAGLGLKTLRGAPCIGEMSLWRIETWLNEHGLEFR
jgi:hypothetical protein